jgi:hypothetical protein
MAVNGVPGKSLVGNPVAMFPASSRTGTRSFSIEEHEIALRWVTLARPTGYRTSVALELQGAEEVLLVYLPGRQSPAFALQALHSTIVLIDCVGMTMRFSTLAEALMAMSPMSKPNRRELLHGGRTACIHELPGFLTRKRLSFGGRIVGAFRRIGHHVWQRGPERG